MALTTKNYAWNGLTLSPYAKITQRTLTETQVDGVKKYVCAYKVNVYTTSAKEGDMFQVGYSFLDGENCSLEDAYEDLKTREEFSSWQDA